MVDFHPPSAGSKACQAQIEPLRRIILDLDAVTDVPEPRPLGHTPEQPANACRNLPILHLPGNCFRDEGR